MWMMPTKGHQFRADYGLLRLFVSFDKYGWEFGIWNRESKSWLVEERLVESPQQGKDEAFEIATEFFDVVDKETVVDSVGDLEWKEHIPNR